MKIMGIRYCLVSCLALSLVAIGLVGSAHAATGKPGSASDEWSVGLGVGGGWIPEYRGADSYKAEGLPWIEARKGRLSINPITGLSYDLLSSERWTLAPVLSYGRGRDNAGALTRFDDVHGSVLAGALVSWTGGPWQATGDIATPVAGDLDGLRVRGYLRYRGKLTERLHYGAGPGASWGNSRWNQALFDVSAADSARSGIRQYRADGEYIRASLNSRLTYLVTTKLSVSTIARYSRLFGDAADSPVVQDVGDANQWHGSLAINYQF